MILVKDTRKRKDQEWKTFIFRQRLALSNLKFDKKTVKKILHVELQSSKSCQLNTLRLKITPYWKVKFWFWGIDN